MSFVIESGSKQYVVDYGQKIVVDRLDVKEGETIDLDLVLAFADDASVKKVQAKVVAHQRGKKIRVVKYKSKSNYHRQQGHRSEQTVLEIIK